VIAPGKTIGILGGGQLGRMTALAARKMGYRIHIFEPGENSPAGQVADVEVNASYRDEERLVRFLDEIEVATFEFENIPAQTLNRAATVRPVRPSPEVLLICQNREREKLFLRKHKFPHARFEVVSSAEELARAVEAIGRPCVLKTADFGYDGKGQIKIGPYDSTETVWKHFNAPRGVVEQWIRYRAELSVICSANPRGDFSTFPVSENIHTDHILEYSIVPARLEEKVQSEGREIAEEIARAIGLVGLLAVEFFLTEENSLIVNELAPRPHNSGHYTFDACVTSQFEQQVRAVCDLPLGSPRLLTPVVMCNLLGDLWQRGVPDWNLILEHPEAKLHLYGKEEARPGRKMGHFNVLGENVEEALVRAREIKMRLVEGACTRDPQAYQR
jgi:5-(carboxyamino)imidazole ribonucleotide synthase